MLRAPVIAITHGGGPMPVLGEPSQAEIAESLKSKVPKVLKLGSAEAPRAIVLVTAHWQTAQPTISNGTRHELYYDYHGFPPETYRLKHDAPGSPEVARDVYDAFSAMGFKPEMDDSRGWDHGVFVPLILINPSANIPVVQVSVLESEDPAALYRMGEALEKLRQKNIAIVCSGSASFHNRRLLFNGSVNTAQFQKRHDEWNEAIHEAVSQSNPKIREKKLKAWRQITNSTIMHPVGGAEHFSPLIVAAGAGGDGRPHHYYDKQSGISMATYYWE